MAEMSTAYRQSHRAQLLFALYALAGGVISFAGWYADVPRLTDWPDNGISIQPNATIAVMSAALALLFLQTRYRFIPAVLGIFVSAIGLTTLVEYATGIDFGIDALLLFDRTWGRGAVVVPAAWARPARSRGPCWAWRCCSHRSRPRAAGLGFLRRRSRWWR
jgi:hypothetical protein